MNDSPATPAGPAKRKHRPGLQRVSIACERCRSRKNKCDRKLPECSTCKAAGATCVVLDRLTNRQYPRGHVEELETEVDTLKARVEELELENSTLKQELGRARSQSGRALSVRASMSDARGTPEDIIDPSSASPFKSLSEDINVVPLDITSNRRYIGDSSGLFFGKIVQAVLLLADYKGEQGPASNSLRLRVAGRAPTAASNEPPPLTQFEFPDLDLAHRLQNAYFTCRWPALPFMHWPAFLNNHFGPSMASRAQASDVSLFITLMVLALGSIDLKRQDSSFGDKHLAYFQYATTNYLGGLLKDDSIETVQGLLLIAQFAINEHQSANAWLVTGQAVRTAIDLGLHRMQTASEDLYKFEMRKRVFWSAYALDRNVSITLGRPCAIRDEDIDTPLPCNMTDQDLLTGNARVDNRIEPNHPLDMSTFIHIIRLRQIQSKIQSLFYAANTSQTQAEGTHYHQTRLRTQLEHWISTSPRYSHPTMATFQSTEWFQIAYSHALLLLYRPSPASPVIDVAALQICADSAIGLISSYSTLYAKNKITYTWIALHGLFMASVTMLYTLYVSPSIRSSTTKVVVRSNVASCLALFQVMAEYWPLAIRCHEIVDHLGDATLALFDAPSQPTTTAEVGNLDHESPQQHFGQIDTEFMDWFGTRDSHVPFSFEELRNELRQNTAALGAVFDNALDNNEPMATGMDSLATNVDDFFSMEFDTTIPMMMNVFGNNWHQPAGLPRPAEASENPLLPNI